MDNATNMSRYKRLLLAKRWELLSANGGRLLLEADGGLAGDEVIGAPTEGEVMLDAHPNQAWSNLWRAISWALVQMNNGKYGNCTCCGNRISSARLEAVPWTDSCLSCMQQEAICY